MSLKKVLIAGTLITSIVSGSLFYYNKNVQAKKAADEYSTLKTKYLNEEIGYKEFTDKIDELEKSGIFEESDSDKKDLKDLEDQRTEYDAISTEFANKDYSSVLAQIKELSKKVTNEDLKSKITDLEKAVDSSIEDDVDQDIKDQKYDDGKKLLEDNREYLTKDFIDSNESKIEAAVKEKENNKLKAEQDAKKNVSPAIASYLNGYTPNPDKENAVSSFASRSNFLVWVDIENQTTNVFVGNKGNWKLIKEFTCSTGAPGSDTPKGIYKVTSRGNWFYNAQINEGAKNYVQFFGNYLFHSLPMDKNKNITDYTLGTPRSHGCIRLSLDNSKWIFNNIVNGTTVYIS